MVWKPFDQLDRNGQALRIAGMEALYDHAVAGRCYNRAVEMLGKKIRQYRRLYESNRK